MPLIGYGPVWVSMWQGWDGYFCLRGLRKYRFLIGEILTKPVQGRIQRKPHTFTFAIDE